MRRWSKLQKEIYNLITSGINFQIHCAAYPMRSQYGSTDLPRYWITLDKEIIFDYPKDFVKADGTIVNHVGEKFNYPYTTEVSDISNLLREYIETSKEELFDKHFESDKWGLTNILKATDRRIGARRLNELKRKTESVSTNKIIERRLNLSDKTMQKL